MDYNATATLARHYGRMAEAELDAILDALADYHPAIGAEVTGEAHVVITLPAVGLGQAIATARAVLAPLRPIGLEVVPTDYWDRRTAAIPVPDLLSVTEVADRLGVSPQAVRQRIESGSLPAIKIGNAWAVPAANLPAA